MKKRIEDLQKQFEKELTGVSSASEVEGLKVRYLGKKGPIQELMQALRTAPSEERPHLGKAINDLKVQLETICKKAHLSFAEQELSSMLEKEGIDITLPGKAHFRGREHPLKLVMQKVLDIFTEMGFSIQEGPDIDTDYYNYEGLNFPEDHPAREMQDTYYLDDHFLLRSHTSNTQLRLMEKHAPPIRFVVPGTVYRNETISARSHVFFHQVEGVYIDEHVTFTDLLSTMQVFWNRLFENEVEIRFRPSYFPFVEPGMEVDLKCISCSGKGCRLCKHTGWLEVGGAGMVHPNVLQNGGIDPEKYQGYAWGIGIERLAMLLYRIKDIRLFTENDLNFLTQFG